MADKKRKTSFSVKKRRRVFRPSPAANIDRLADKPISQPWGLDEEELRSQRPPHWS